ncbi:hypothetical protein F0562_027198 [Nyssa sinensis]|uniref:BHLH domain-containing protein n=1 Tax=Nyssa sinensis TaxID=561372 RepID=A0A5J5B4P2_9ASTE|nr:hypothetical protein F0562_027198 [Nyssa sinensis]
MESANLHHQHHQLQDQLVGSSPLATPSFYGVGSTHAWTPNTILNNGNFNPNMNGVIMNSRDSRQQNEILLSSLNNSMIQDLGFHWPSNAAAGSFTTTDQSAHDLHLARIKEELSDSYPKFTDMINSSATTIDQDFQLQPTSYLKNHEQKDLNELSERLLLRNFSSGCQINGPQLPPGEYYYSNAQNCSRGNFSQIFPTVNISNLNRSSSAISSPLDMNMQALELFSSAGVCGNLSQPSHGHLGLFKESLSYGLDHMQQSSHRPSNSPTKKPPFTDGVTELAKRPSSILKPRAPPAATKKSRLESRATCPPFKVRKEKLGDRIAALQQLVAPFGKTDTASVLMEAIGYIKFLQNQVETLSVPYMKSSRNKIRSRITQEDNIELGLLLPGYELESLRVVYEQAFGFLSGGEMGSLQGPVICPAVHAKQTGVYTLPVYRPLMKATIFRNGCWRFKGINCGRINSVNHQLCIHKCKSVRCSFSSSSNGDGSMAENFNENDEDYVNSSVVEAVEVKSGPDGFIIKMRDGRHLRCVHNNPQGGHLADYAPHPAIVLKMEDGTGLLLPIIVLEMPSVLLMAAMRNVQIARPTLYEVVKEMIDKMGYEVKLVRVTKRVHEAYFAQLYLTKLGNETECVSFDLRPSDAINIAIRSKVPIQVNKYLAYSDGMRVIESAKSMQFSSADGLLFTELDRTLPRCCSVEGQTHSTTVKEELDIAGVTEG